MMRKKHQGAYLNDIGSWKFCIAPTCANCGNTNTASHLRADLSSLRERHDLSETIAFPTFSSQRPFQCSKHSLSIFEFTRTEYPINGYMVIHDLSSNTVNNILMLGRLPREPEHVRKCLLRSHIRCMLKSLRKNSQTIAIQFRNFLYFLQYEKIYNLLLISI